MGETGPRRTIAGHQPPLGNFAITGFPTSNLTSSSIPPTSSSLPLLSYSNFFAFLITLPVLAEILGGDFGTESLGALDGFAWEVVGMVRRSLTLLEKEGGD